MSWPEENKAPAADPRVVAALAGSDADAERLLALKTRRAVYKAALATKDDQAQGRRNLFTALVVGGVLAMMILPAIWSGLQEIISGAAVTDLPVMLSALGVMLFAAVAAVLFLLSDEQRHSGPGVRHGRR